MKIMINANRAAVLKTVISSSSSVQFSSNRVSAVKSMILLNIKLYYITLVTYKIQKIK